MQQGPVDQFAAQEEAVLLTVYRTRAALSASHEHGPEGLHNVEDDHNAFDMF